MRRLHHNATMLRPHSWSIRTLLLVIALLLTLPWAALFVRSLGVLQAEAILGAEAQGTHLAEAMLAAEEQHYHDLHRTLETLALLPAVQQRDGRTLSPLLEGMKRQLPDCTNLFAAAPDGGVYAMATPGAAPFSVADRPYFQEALSTGRLAVGGFAIGRGSGRPSLHLALPVRDAAGRIQTVLGAARSLQPDLPMVPLPPGTTWVLTDLQGRVLRAAPATRLSPGDPVSRTGWPPPSRTTALHAWRRGWLRGTLTTFRPLFLEPGTPAAMLELRFPEADLFAGHRAILRRDLMVLGAAFLGVLALLLAASHGMLVRPLRRLAEDAIRLSHAPRPAVSVPTWSGREITSLATLFQDLGHRLDEREAEQRQSQTEIRQLSSYLGHVIDHAGVWINALDPAGKVILWNRTAEQISGFTRHQVLGCPDIWSWLYPDADYRAWVKERARTVLEDEAHIQDLETAIRTRSGETRYLLWQSQVLKDAQGTLIGSLAVARDITESRWTALALQDAEARYQGLFQNCTDAIHWVEVAADGQFLTESLNPAAERLLGIRSQAALGRPFPDLLPEAFRQPMLDQLRACVQSGQAAQVENETLVDGRRLIFSSLLVPIREENGRILRLVGLTRDITARRSSEEDLAQTQRNESLGVLAGGLAHDFNNLLTAAMGNIGLAQEEAGPFHPSTRLLERATSALMKSADLTRQMMAYAGRSRMEPVDLDLNALVEEFTHLLTASIPKKVTLDVDLEPGAMPIRADRPQVQQVVLNLITNAAEAIGDAAGTIQVRTRMVRMVASDFQDARIGQGRTEGVYVRLEVEDTGSGMDAALQHRIFEPFFSTKATGRGLGLSAMLGILNAHGASLHLRSQPGKGTCFTLAFPCRTEATLPSRGPASRTAPARLQGTVLLVDDEATILDATSMALRALGLHVIRAEDGQEAVERMEAQGSQVDLVLMDLSMPRLNGLEAFKTIHTRHPDLPVILSSGFSGQLNLSDLLPLGVAGVLPKPYRIHELKALLARWLSTEAAVPSR